MPVIDVYSDVWCPFAHVGLTRLVAARSARERFEVRLRLRAWPLELVNGQPLDRFAVAQKVDALRWQVAPDLFAGFTPDAFPRSTLPALDLTAAAYRQGGDDAGERVGLALRRALFEDGLSVDDPEVLATIARDVGIEPARPRDRESVLDDLADGRSRGVIGSPHFFVAGDDFYCPTLTIRHIGDAIDVQADTSRFEPFLERCFGVAA